MKIRRTALRAGIAGAAALAALAATQLNAGADPAPSTTDVVGVGSDVIQNSVDFLADGYGALPGYNTAGNPNRIANFDATGDGNGRNAFVDPTAGGGYLNPTVVLRAGTAPVTRPNGGGVGINALLFDGSTNQQKIDDNGNVLAGAGNQATNWGPNDIKRIDFARSPNPPTAANQASAEANLGTKLHTVKFASDQQVIATASTTHAAPYLSDAQLVNIYAGYWRDWRQVPGAPDVDASWYFTDLGAGHQSISEEKAGANDFSLANVHFSNATDEPIYAEVPQDYAGVLTIFVTELAKASASIDATKKTWSTIGLASLTNYTAINGADANALVAGTPHVHQVQQNDITAITNLPGKLAINAIVPFPVSRYKLVQNGYFFTPSTATPASLPYYKAGVTSGEGQATLSVNAVGAPSATATSYDAANHYGISLQLPVVSPDSAAGHHPTGWDATFGDTSDTFGPTINFFAIFRDSDYQSDTAWQPGSALNWVQTLLTNPGGPAPFVNSAPGKAIINSLGLTATYKDDGTADATHPPTGGW